MTKRFRWIEKFKKAPTAYSGRLRPTTLYLDNWRSISVGVLRSYRGGYIHGLFILVDKYAYFCPSMTMKNFLDFMLSDEEVKEQFFTESFDHKLPLCYKCKGNGKFDWVNRATQIRTESYQRQKNIVYLYTDINKDPDHYVDLLLSKTELNRGDLICKECHGTGIILDARHKYLNGFVAIKHRLKERSIYDVHKIVTDNFNKGE